ncbi:MAG: hypothetical protein ACRDOE_17755 [Streptosporangiaceae bacterium]
MSIASAAAAFTVVTAAGTTALSAPPWAPLAILGGCAILAPVLIFAGRGEP